MQSEHSIFLALPERPLVVYYYPDAEIAYSEEEEIRTQHRHVFSQNGAFDYDLGYADNFTGTPNELRDISRKK